MNIHIVDSVKGGSGKSTFSAILSSFITPQEKKKVCIIDLDLLGTSWELNYKGIFHEEFNQKMVYLNDLVKDFNFYKNTIFIQKIPVTLCFKEKELEQESQIVLDVIFCDPGQKEKNTFKITDKAYSPDISYDIFHESVMQLIELLNELGYTDIILDMPPNSEPYSDKVLNSCLKSKSVFSFPYTVSLYMVANINAAHIDSTFNWYEDFMNNPSSQHIVTINDVIDKKDEPGSTKEKKKKWLKESQYKLFYVFNATRNRKYTVSNLFPEVRKDFHNNLAYYYINYDAKYIDSMDSKFGVTTTVDFGEIKITRTDLNDFKLYDEWFVTTK